MMSTMPKLSRDAIVRSLASSRRVARATRALASRIESADLKSVEVSEDDTLVTSIKAVCEAARRDISPSGKSRP